MIGIKREYEIILYTIARSPHTKAKLFVTLATENIAQDAKRNIPCLKFLISITDFIFSFPFNSRANMIQKTQLYSTKRYTLSHERAKFLLKLCNPAIQRDPINI